MILPKKNPLEKLSAPLKARQQRLKKEYKKTPSVQNSIYFKYQFENGIMNIEGNRWSQTYSLGDFPYNTASQSNKLGVIDSYGEGLNSLDAGDAFQLLVLNRRVDNETIKQVLYEPEKDKFDVYREEYNDIIQERFSVDEKNFKVEKYVTLTTEAYDQHLASNQLWDLGQSVENAFQEMEISFDKLNGIERLEIFNYLLRYSPYLPFDYKDIALSGLKSKDFISPNRIVFSEDFIRLDDKFAKVLYVRQYPEFLSDRMIKSICDTGVEFALTIHAEAQEPDKVAKEIANQQSLANRQRLKDQREAFKNGIDGSLGESQKAVETSQTTEKWKRITTSGGQKVFQGVIAVFYTADTKEELQLHTDKIKAAGRKVGVIFDDCYYYQEEALNTILPIGRAFLDVKKDFMRPFTTANVATQIPFTNVDLQSESPRALYYGQNQLSNNLITLDRKRDLNAANGLIVGSTGSGKGMTTKTEEVIPTLLKYLEDRSMVVDPEDEYSGIAEVFGGQVINLSPKSSSHFNLLDLPKTDQILYDNEDQEIDLIADKANLLMALFDSIMKEVTDDHTAIIDKVTRLVYKRYEEPTLVEWQEILEEQPEAAAKELAVRSEIYTRGSLNLFAHKTNVDIDNRFVVFNLKGLSKKLKPFALLVLQDFIWQQVLHYQGKQTIWLYWDELHLTFRSQTDATFFAELWARIRKYGAIVTGITQNPGTILAWEEGRNLMSNTEFFILLRMKPQDIEKLSDVTEIPEAMQRYIQRPKQKGSGLIIAGDTIVPFQNPIPKNTKLYKLAQTDA